MASVLGTRARLSRSFISPNSKQDQMSILESSWILPSRILTSL